MDPVPNLSDLSIEPQFNKLEQDLLLKFRNDTQCLLLKKIDEVRDRFSSITSSTFEQHTKAFRKEVLSQAESLFKLSLQPINSASTKKLLTSLQTSIVTLERLIFLARYFNPENDEDYLKMLNLRANKLTGIVFNFNSYILSWVKDLIEGVHLDPNDLLAMQIDSSKKDVHAVTTNLFTTKIPQKPAKRLKDLYSNLMLDYYHIKSTYDNIRGLLDIFTQSKIPEKIQEIINSLTNESNPDSPALQNLGEGFIKSNPVKLELEKELKKLKEANDSGRILEYLFQSKQNLGKIMEDIPVYEEEIRTATIKYISQTFARREDLNLDEDHLPIDKSDDVIIQEIQQYWATGESNLQQFLKDWENEAKIEIIRLINQQKNQLQGHMAKYIEERLVVFITGKGDFTTVNFAKQVQEFCVTANKEFKKVLVGRFDQEYVIWPLYYCFVSENQCDFYLVEYMADSDILKVYLTASPMLSTLNKQLSKLNLKKIEKQTISTSVLNYYDIDINLEFRQIFLNQESVDSNQAKSGKSNKLPQGLKDLVFTTIFLLCNTPEVKQLSSINFTTKDFAAFYNYAADFHNVFLQFTNNINDGGIIMSPLSLDTYKDSVLTDLSILQSPLPQSPATFDFRAPFIDLKQPKHVFLIHLKNEMARENSVLLMRNIAQQFGDMVKYQPLCNDEKMQKTDFLEKEVTEYLSKNELKTSFHFDDVNYLMTYLQKKNSRNELIKILTKKQSQLLFHTFKSKDERVTMMPGVEDYSKYIKIFLIFAYTSESSPGLMLCIDRKSSTIVLHKHDKQTVEESIIFNDFALYVVKLLGIDEDLQTVHVRYKTSEDVILRYFKNSYFAFTSLFRDLPMFQQSIFLQKCITMDDLIQSFKDFLSITVLENNLEVFKICNLILQDKNNNIWKTYNLGTFLKFNQLKTTLAALVNKIALSKVKYTIVTFNFLGAMGFKTYYVSFSETFEKVANESGYGPQSPTGQTQTRRHLVDIFTLDYNLRLDDQEVLVIVAHVCQAFGTHFSLNRAYNIQTKYNMLFSSHIDLSLNTMGSLICLTNCSMIQALKKISQSIISHYEVIEGLLDQVTVFAQTPVEFAKQRSLSTPSKPDAISLTQVKKTDSLEKMSMMRSNYSKKTKTSDNFFEESQVQKDFCNALEAKLMLLLNENHSTFLRNNLDIYSFLNILNCEENPAPSVFTFIVDEEVMKKLLDNELTILTNISAFLIEEVTGSKTKYEETLDLKYSETILFFQISKPLFVSSKILLISYNIEKAECTYYYVQDDNEHQNSESLNESLQHNQTYPELHTHKDYLKPNNMSQEMYNSKDNLDHLHNTEYKFKNTEVDKASEQEYETNDNEYNGNFKVPYNLRKLMEHFHATATKNRKPGAELKIRCINLMIDENIYSLISTRYELLGKFLIYYFSHQGAHCRGNTIKIILKMFNGFLCTYSDKLFGSSIENSRVKESYKQLCNLFLDKSCPLGEKVVLLAFLNGKASLEQLNVIETCIKSFKMDFQKIYGIENAFFCFTLNLKNTEKYFLLYLSGKGKKNLNVVIFTNGQGEEDTLVEKLIKAYCLTDGSSGGEDKLIEKVHMFTLDPPNLLFNTYIEVSTVLLAHKVSNNVENPLEFCANLACSPVFYMNELKELEAKCDELGLLLDATNLISQSSQVSQASQL